GAGVRIAIVDTGVALSHPAFVGRNIEAVSFVPYENSEDRHGHGTHCFGTACGATVADEPRYGIATGAEALVAKCLDATGLGRESWILAGIDWALSQGADIISLSLGLPYGPDGAADPIYTQLGEIALAEGSLLIAASGNGSSRPGRIEPALLPAAVPSVLSVGALAEDLTIAPFSNGRAFGDDRQVDLLAPGVGVYSTHLPPIKFKSLSGTSMAAPHVAGIAGLLAESDPSLRGRALWDALVALQQDLSIGQGAAGLVRAPAGQRVGS
ncbi:MAG: S8 family serine peptidase, partial [Pseudomonadota bacterium]